MTTGHLRDASDLATGFATWLAARDPRRGRPEVTLRRPATGWSNETLLATATHRDRVDRCVVRLPPRVPAYPHHDFPAQAAVHELVRAHDIPAPAVLAVELDPAWMGAPFLVMDLVEGRAPGEAPALDPWIVEASAREQAGMQDAFVTALACIHRIDPREGSGATLPLRRGVRTELDYWSTYIEWASDGSPPVVLADVLAWCRTTVPPEPVPSLLWGDARIGNVMFDDRRALTAVLDWELATVGPAEMDLAWYLALDELTNKATGASVPGFRDRDTLVGRYERTLGRAVEHLGWHEIFALVRSVAVTDKLARLATSAGVPYPGVAGDANPMLRYLARRVERYEPEAGAHP